MTDNTSWMMVLVRVNVRESSDSRRHSHDEFDETEIVTRPTKEEVLAYCYGIREAQRKHIPISSYDSGSIIHFYGPFEVVNNASWTSEETGLTEHWFEEYDVMDEKKVAEAIDSGAVLHQIMK